MASKKRKCKYGKRKTDGHCRKTPKPRARKRRSSTKTASAGSSKFYPDLMKIANKANRISCDRDTARKSVLNTVASFALRQFNDLDNAPISKAAKKRRQTELYRIKSFIDRKALVRCQGA